MQFAKILYTQRKPQTPLKHINLERHIMLWSQKLNHAKVEYNVGTNLKLL